METVVLKYRIRKQGKYCASVSTCEKCKFSLWDIEDSTVLTIGWFEFKGEWFIVWECPKCFTKWYHHDRKLEFYRQHLIVENINQEK